MGAHVSFYSGRFNSLVLVVESLRSIGLPKKVTSRLVDCLITSKIKTHLILEVGWFQTTTRLFNGSGELNEPQQFGEPYLLSTSMYDIINAIGRVASSHRRLHEHADGRDLVRSAALGMTTSQLGHPAASGKLIRFLKTLGVTGV